MTPPAELRSSTAARMSLRSRLALDPRRVIVFDDDPTGTQTVSAVDVLLQASDASLDRFFASRVRALYVLTNSRALSREAAVARLVDLHGRVARAAARADTPWFPILRGDSTLRGHVFAEIDAIAAPDAVVLFVPAYPEGGRVTRDGQHLIRIDGEMRNVADTEFARDPFFGYRSRDLSAWVAEVGAGRPARVLTLAELRREGPRAVTAALLAAAPGTVVMPDAETRGDIEHIALGLLDAEVAGRVVVVRSASTFAAVRAGLRSDRVRAVDVAARGRILVVCGSHTEGSRRQLEALERSGVPIHTLGPTDDIAVISQRLRSALESDGIAAVATPREFVGEADFAAGADLMSRLMLLANSFRPQVDAVVAKGGITSAELAISLGAEVARVKGQLEPGVALWMLDLRSSRLPYAVVPGNVGDRDTLVRVVKAMRPRDAAEGVFRRRSAP